MKMEKNNHLISWEAREFEKYDKGPLWFIVLGLLTLGLVTVAILMKNIVFALIILLSGFLIAIYALKQPRRVKFAITKEAFLIDQKPLLYEEIRSFWIFDTAHNQALSFKTKKLTQPFLSIPLGNQDPKKLREILTEFIEEQEHEESMIDALARRLKF